jgi:hypothetical protein
MHRKAKAGLARDDATDSLSGLASHRVVSTQHGFCPGHDLRYNGVCQG